jgi:hypothetical protein
LVLSHWDRVDRALACMALGDTILSMGVSSPNSALFANDEYEMYHLLWQLFIFWSILDSFCLIIVEAARMF